MQSLYEITTNVFEPISRFWSSERTERAVSGVLVLLFLVALAGIECKRQGFLPPALAAITPSNHFHAVSLAFTLVLILEVIGLIFVLPCSFSKSVGKQFEILSLILLRNSFKALVDLPEPIHLTGDWSPVLTIAAEGVGALLVFALLGFYYKVQNPNYRTAKSGYRRYCFIASKKMVAMVLLVIFSVLGGKALWQGITGHHTFDFFDTFYTVLIFADILLVLLSQRFLPGYQAVFRNSGYALSTLFIRLALAAPPPYNILLGIGAAVFAVAMTLIFNAFYAQFNQAKEHA